MINIFLFNVSKKERFWIKKTPLAGAKSVFILGGTFFLEKIG
jgi:hypothetical protein